MARFVVLEFESDEEAAQLAEMVRKQTVKGKRYRVAGVFARPKRFCECPQPEGYHKNQIVRGSRFGWWVCIICKRARPGAHNANNLMSASDLMTMPGDPLSRGLEYRVDNLSIFEVPTHNIDRGEENGG